MSAAACVCAVTSHRPDNGSLHSQHKQGLMCPSRRFAPSASKLLSGRTLPTLNLYICVFPSLPSSLQTSNESRGARKSVWQRKGTGL